MYPHMVSWHVLENASTQRDKVHGNQMKSVAMKLLSSISLEKCQLVTIERHKKYQTSCAMLWKRLNYQVQLEKCVMIDNDFV